MPRLAEHAVKGHPVTSTLWPMDINSWVSAFYDVFHMDVLAPWLMCIFISSRVFGFLNFGIQNPGLRADIQHSGL